MHTYVKALTRIARHNTKINIHTDFVKNKIWLITVRHNLYPAPTQVQQIVPPSESYEERLPFEFSIHLKSNNSLKWDQVILSEDDLLKNEEYIVTMMKNIRSTISLAKSQFSSFTKGVDELLERSLQPLSSNFLNTSVYC